MLVLAAKLFFVAIMLWAAQSDLTTMTIPNRIVLVLLAGFVILVPLANIHLIQGLVAGLIALTISFVMFTRGWIGGGDAKLFAATGLWVGLDQLGLFALATSLFGAVLAFVFLAFRAAKLPPALGERGWIARLHQQDGGIPYGVAIAAAGFAVLIATPWSAIAG